MSRFMPSVMEYAFATRSPAHASMQYAPTARSMLSCAPRALMSSLVRPRVESTCISMSCCLSRYSSPVFFISGAVALRPERNATARAMSMAMERKRFLLFFISLMRSFLKAVTVPSPFLCVFYKMRLPFYAFYRSWVVVVFLMGNGAVFICITWSAMGVRALLWVITTTVTPFWRQVSCKSFSMDLPVT